MAARTLADVKSGFRIVQARICELRSLVDDLEADARQIWEDAKTPEDEEAASAMMDELTALSDVLSNWESDD